MVNLLNKSPDVFCYGEILNERWTPTGEPYDDYSESLGIIDQAFQGKYIDGLKKFREKAIKDNFQGYLPHWSANPSELFPEDIKNICFKFFAYQSKALIEELYVNTEYNLLYLHRKSIFDLAISYYIAKKRNIWAHNEEYEKQAERERNNPYTVDIQEFSDLLKEKLDGVNQTYDIYQNYKGPKEIVYYEDLDGNYTETYKFFDLLGAHKPHPNIMNKVFFTKQASTENYPSLITNYEQIKKYAEDNGYAC